MGKRRRITRCKFGLEKMKVGDLVYWKDDMMKGYPDDNFFIVIDLEKQLGAQPYRHKEATFSYTHVRVVSPSGWSRLIDIGSLEVVSSGDH